MTQLEKVLAEQLSKVLPVDIPAIIVAAQEACMGGCKTEVVTTPPVIVETAIGPVTVPAPKAEKAKPAKKEVEAVKPVETPVVETKPEPAVEKPAPVVEKPAVGIDLSGLFVGTGPTKQLNKAVFLAAVENAKTLAALVALNATCDCGFATGDYTEETAGVLKRKLTRWGNAQE